MAWGLADAGAVRSGYVGYVLVVEGDGDGIDGVGWVGGNGVAEGGEWGVDGVNDAVVVVERVGVRGIVGEGFGFDDDAEGVDVGVVGSEDLIGGFGCGYCGGEGDGYGVVDASEEELGEAHDGSPDLNLSESGGVGWVCDGAGADAGGFDPALEGGVGDGSAGWVERGFGDGRTAAGDVG